MPRQMPANPHLAMARVRTRAYTHDHPAEAVAQLIADGVLVAEDCGLCGGLGTYPIRDYPCSSCNGIGEASTYTLNLPTEEGGDETT
jgi:hypothetical protein